MGRGTVEQVTTPDLDLLCGATFRVRVYRTDRTTHEQTVAFEGETTFSGSPMPYVRRLGHRWELRLDAVPGFTAVAAVGGNGYAEYRPGAGSIESGEWQVAYLLDRGDPEKPYGEDGPTLREALEMSLDTFCVSEGLGGVTFS